MSATYRCPCARSIAGSLVAGSTTVADGLSWVSVREFSPVREHTVLVEFHDRDAAPEYEGQWVELSIVTDFEEGVPVRSRVGGRTIYTVTP